MLENNNYYSDSRISQSKIKQFINSKSLYKAIYIDNYIKQKDTESMGFGRLYHDYLYQPELIEDKYIIIPEDCKVDGMMGKFIEFYINNTAEEAYRLSGFEQSFNTTWKSFTEGKNKDKYQKYHNLLLEAEDKVVITDLDKSIAKNMKDIYIRDNKHLQIAIEEDWLIFSEQEIFFKSNFSNLELKLKIDRIYIKPDFSQIIIEDAKSTEDYNTQQFIYTIKKYRYDIQQSFYKLGVQNWIEQKFNKIIPYYNIQFIFIPQRKSYPYEILDFIEVDSISEDKAYKDWTEALGDLEACITTNNWGIDKSNYEENRKIVKIW